MSRAASPCVALLTFVLGSFLFVSSVHANDDAAVSAYHMLASADVEAKHVDAAPEQSYTRVDVSSKVRSASFGHKTTLLVAPSGKEFYVEYGRSTNRPQRVFGPFVITN